MRTTHRPHTSALTHTHTHGHRARYHTDRKRDHMPSRLWRAHVRNALFIATTTSQGYRMAATVGAFFACVQPRRRALTAKHHDILRSSCLHASLCIRNKLLRRLMYPACVCVCPHKYNTSTTRPKAHRMVRLAHTAKHALQSSRLCNHSARENRKTLLCP